MYNTVATIAVVLGRSGAAWRQGAVLSIIPIDIGDSYLSAEAPAARRGTVAIP
jgi:hypothetical protein